MRSTKPGSSGLKEVTQKSFEHIGSTWWPLARQSLSLGMNHALDQVEKNRSRSWHLWGLLGRLLGLLDGWSLYLWLLLYLGRGISCD
jgi:hypothetical protein